VFDDHIFESIRRITPSWRNEYEITDAIQNLIERGLRVEPHIVSGWWKDTGKPADILDANRVILQGISAAIEGTVDADSAIDGAVRIGEGTEVIGSRIHGPVVIGTEARIINSEIGPFASIGDRVHILNSRVEDSVVLEDSLLRDLKQPVIGSLIGRKVQVSGSPAGAAGMRLLLGDMCETELP